MTASDRSNPGCEHKTTFLIQRVKQGDVQAIDEILLSYQSRLSHFASQLRNPTARLNDDCIVQVVLHRLFQLTEQDESSVSQTNRELWRWLRSLAGRIQKRLPTNVTPIDEIATSLQSSFLGANNSKTSLSTQRQFDIIEFFGVAIGHVIEFVDSNPSFDDSLLYIGQYYLEGCSVAEAAQQLGIGAAKGRRLMRCFVDIWRQFVESATTDNSDENRC